jgi:non-specific protein-tyrosine kinase
VLAVTDASIIATRVDGVLLVIRAGKTKRDLAQKARDQLLNVKAHLLGVVLNGVKSDSVINQYYGQTPPK